jgi:Pyridine nucleotide-disulphide oxidoreductase/Reductase C-terminal
MRRFYAAAARWATLPILALYFGPDSTFAASPGATDTPEKTVPQGEDPPGADNGEQQTAPLSQHNAGLRIDRGIAVDRYLETSAPGVYAVGDIARWPDPHSGENLRIEHWVVAERQGQTAALNMLDQREAFVQVPFFWSQHYDVPINYVGHAQAWDEIDIEGDVMRKDCVLRFKQKGRVAAVASIFRDLESLEAELGMERQATA